MRVTAETREKTRERILECAGKLLSKRGFHETTTRDIARSAKVASGTVFNYFASKEAIVCSMIGRALERGTAEYAIRRRGDESLAEDLFLFVMSAIRSMEAHRRYVGAVLETVMSPFATQPRGAESGDLRAQHMEHVAAILHVHSVSARDSAISMHLYWSLFVGVIAFWINDASPNQQDTLALADRAIQLFVSALHADAAVPIPPGDGRHNSAPANAEAMADALCVISMENVTDNNTPTHLAPHEVNHGS